MKLTMQQILDKYSDCDKFSLTTTQSRYNIKVSEAEFDAALSSIKERQKSLLRKQYEEYKDKLVNYPEFEKLYSEITRECYKFCSEDNKKTFLQNRFDGVWKAQYQKLGLSDTKIEELKKHFFKCSFIADSVGKTTKYGHEHFGYFHHLYSEIAMNIDRENDKATYCLNDGIDPTKPIPKTLKKHLLHYEVSFYNQVTISSGLMINYYFPLNNETKSYLLKFETDFDLTDLCDLALYKDNEVKFSSCTHENFNSLEDFFV